MQRRTNRIIRSLILKIVNSNPQPIREIAKKSGIDWYSTERHLTYLKGRGIVKEVFTHRLLRLFQLTELGIQVVSELQNSKKEINGRIEIQKIIKRYI
jgi:predicted transcriptional regulator